MKESSDFYSTKKEEKIAPLVSEVALPLRRPTIFEIRTMMSNENSTDEKCQICHSRKSTLTGADFYTEGRYCPSCERAMHLSCAAMWAQKSEYTENVFRCPFCYLLLELPKSATKLVKNKTEKQKPQRVRIIDEGEQTIMVLIADEMVSEIDASCSYCNNIFTGQYKAFKCQNCGSYYHEQCLEKMYEEIKACRYCGAKITYEKQ